MSHGKGSVSVTGAAGSEARAAGWEARAGEPDGRRAAELDRRYVWHPFTPMRQWLAEEPLVIVEAEGVRLRDSAGRWYYDGNSSLWVNVHGHRRPEIDAAIRDQLGRVAHSTALGLANVPASLLAERLVALAPPGLSRVFYSDNGSTAVEVALKMAFQYWRHRGRPEKSLFLKLQNAYHGDTIGAVSVGGIDLFHAAFAPLLFETMAAPSPYCYRCPLGFPYEASPFGREGRRDGGAGRAPGESPRGGRGPGPGGGGCGLACAAEFERLVAEHADRLAAAIVEPMVQAAAGIITMPPGFLRRAWEACRRHGVLFIADEVATGFGRTGLMFACQHEGVAPDLMGVAKGLTGGYLPLAATLVSEEVLAAFLGEEGEHRTFYHGHSYTANQLGCAAALASLDIFARERVLEGLPRKAALVARGLEELAGAPGVGEVRQRGLMVGIEVVRDRATKEPFPPGWRVGHRVCRRCRELGLITRPLGDVVVFLPPLAATAAELAEMLAILVRAVRETLGELDAA